MSAHDIVQRLVDEIDSERGVEVGLEWLELLTDAISTIATLTTERDEARALHQELLSEVGNVYRGETRHEAAKRYIRER